MREKDKPNYKAQNSMKKSAILEFSIIAIIIILTVFMILFF